MSDIIITQVNSDRYLLIEVIADLPAGKILPENKAAESHPQL